MRHQQFGEVSPEVGELDEGRFDQLVDESADRALALLADLTAATDERLRELARRLAGRILVDIARAGVARTMGVGRIQSRRGGIEGDLDLDASLETIAAARAAHTPTHADELVIRGWRRPDTALCLLVDRSGSMVGERLASAAIAAAAISYRHADNCSVIAFGAEAVVLKSQGEHRSPDELVGDLLRLRGHGTTDLGLAFRAAQLQLGRSRAGRKITLLLSDCRATAGGDPIADAARAAELAIIAPAEDTADAEALATSVGGRWVSLAGPSGVAEAVAAAMLGRPI